MDPLSISASAVSFLAISITCAKKLRRIISDANHAPDEILALSNEIADLEIIFGDIETFHQQLSEGVAYDNVKRRITTLLAKAKAKIYQLESCSAELFSTTEDGKLKFNRVAWVRKKSKLCSLLQEFVGIKRNAALLLATTTASQSARIEVSLHALRMGWRADSTQPAIAASSNSTVSEEGAGLVSSSSSMTTWENLDPGLTSSNVPAPRSQAITADWGTDGTLSTFLQTVRQVAQFGSMTFHVNRLAKCNGNCTCVCHSRTIMQSPRLLNQLLGHLFIGYAGLPIFTSQCDTKDCTNQYSRQMQVSYSFPGWLLLKTVDVVGAMTYNNEPSLGIKVRNRVNGGTANQNSLFNYARNGNLPGIINMFKQRKASPNDISAGGGLSPLHFALELGNVETCQFFLDIGVDPYFKNDRGFSDAHEVSSLILAKSRASRAWDPGSIFRKIACEHAEIWDFTFLHSVVVGILHVDLQSTLLKAEHKANVNTPDSYGRTPIFWAALRGDDHAVKLLLRTGAKHSPQDGELRTPLHAAIQAGSIECAELLILAGASVHTPDVHGHTSIHIAAWADDNEALMGLIHMAGADLNARDRNNGTPLACTACLDHYRMAGYLLRSGAEVDTLDNQHDSPLFEAARYGNLEVLRLLLSYGAGTELANKKGLTLLHIVACYGTAETMTILSQADLHGLNIKSRDVEGRTAQEAFQERLDLFPELENAFAALLRSLGEAEQDQEDDEDLTFFDAATDLQEQL